MDTKQKSGHLSLEELRAAVDARDIDTVLLAMTDMQGRLQGKRLTAEHFLGEVVEHGAEGCSYQLAVDVDMSTVGGYAMSSWERRVAGRQEQPSKTHHDAWHLPGLHAGPDGRR